MDEGLIEPIRVDKRDRSGERGLPRRRWENLSRRENELFPGGAGKDFLK
jgi:hypothetical protein